MLRHGWNATAYQILNPGLELWFSRRRDAVAGCARHRRVRVVAGAPVCRPERLAAVADELEADAGARGERILFFGAGARLEQVVAARADHSLVRLGTQPGLGSHRNGHGSCAARRRCGRSCTGRATRGGGSANGRPSGRTKARSCGGSSTGLATRGLLPLGFLVTLGRVADRRVFVTERRGEAVAFPGGDPGAGAGRVARRAVAACARGPERHDTSAGRRRDDRLAAAGSRYATLGLAPLSRHGGGPGGPAWLRLVLGWVRAHGRRFYNFAGLEEFKASLQPMAWEPIYAI